MKKWIIANFKMYKGVQEAEEYANVIKDLLLPCREKVAVCPSFVCIEKMSKILSDKNVLIGAQNCAEEVEGAYTGEVSAKMLKSVGANLVLLGHSERRRYYHETDEVIAKKLRSALREDLIPVVCLADDGGKDIEDTLRSQLSIILDDLTNTNIVLAFEPVYAIGTGKTMELNEIEETLKLLKNIAKDYIGYMPEVLYGGSVTPLNAKEILNLDSVDGVLVGGASKNPYEMAKICMSRNEQ